MMQDEDLGGPARRNVFRQGVTRISQVNNLYLTFNILYNIIVDFYCIIYV